MTPLVGLLTLSLLAIGLAELLRRLGCSGWRIVGGLAAGILLGPTVFGRVAPSTYESTFLGGGAARAEVHAIDREHGAYLTAWRLGGGSEADRLEKQAEFEIARAEAESRWRAAQRDDTALHRWMTMALAGVILLGGGGRRSRSAPGQALVIGACSWGVPAILTMLIAWMCGYPPGAPARLLAIAAAAIGPWRLTRVDEAIAGQAEERGPELIAASGRVATLLSATMAAIALWPREGGFTAWPAAAICGAPIVGWMCARVCNAAPWRWISERLLMPLLAALVMVKLELLLDASVWIIILVVIVSGDGRWLGTFIGGRLAARRGVLTTMALALPSLAAAPMQLGIVAIGMASGVLPSGLALPLVAGVAVIELSERLRLRMADHLATLNAA